jgi:hypothetical protein
MRKGGEALKPNRSTNSAVPVQSSLGIPPKSVVSVFVQDSVYMHFNTAASAFSNRLVIVTSEPGGQLNGSGTILI